MGWTGCKALVQAGFRPFRWIGTRIAARRPPPSLSPCCHPGLDPGSREAGRGRCLWPPDRCPEQACPGSQSGAWTPDQVRGDNWGVETVAPVGTEPVPKLDRTAVDLFRASTWVRRLACARPVPRRGKTWMAGTSPAMTTCGESAGGRRHRRPRLGLRHARSCRPCLPLSPRTCSGAGPGLVPGSRPSGAAVVRPPWTPEQVRA